MCTASQGNAANQKKKGGELKYLHNEQFYRRRSSPRKHCWLYPTLLLTNSTRLDPVISTFRESLKACYGSLHLVQNDVLQVEYAGEGGQCQHKVPAGEEDFGVTGDPILGCTGSCEEKKKGFSENFHPQTPTFLVFIGCSKRTIRAAEAFWELEERCRSSQALCHTTPGALLCLRRAINHYYGSI